MQPTALLLSVFLLSFNPGGTPPAAPELPRNIWVTPELRDTVARIWQGSPTFRAQCQRIGSHPQYLVSIMVDQKLTRDPWCRAQCVMRVYTSGLVTAAITVPNVPALTELIPHEFEHVVERIDGVNLRSALAQHQSGVFETSNGRIETERARRAGKRAHQEIQTSTLLTARALSTRR